MIRALGIVTGYLLDRALGDPQRNHPVAIFGSVANRLEKQIYDDNRQAGVLYGAILTGGATLAAVGVERAVKRRPLARFVATAITTWMVLGGRSLAMEGRIIASQIDRGQLTDAREQITHLVSRNPENLTLDDIARAATESMAENASDAVVAPLFWGGVAGLPGLVGLRAANTLDAMVGYRNERYQNFGWFSARLDDLLGLIPARLTALLTWLVAPMVGGRRSDVERAVETASQHVSPNAGYPESAFAGALGVQLGGENHYGTTVEYRAKMGNGQPPHAGDLRRSVKLLNYVGTSATVTAAGLALGVAFLGRRRGH